MKNDKNSRKNLDKELVRLNNRISELEKSEIQHKNLFGQISSLNLLKEKNNWHSQFQ